MVPEAIKEMVKVPGVYRVHVRGSNTYSIVRVKEDGTIHQLNRLGQEDGVLSPDGWLYTDVLVNGPFQ